MVARPVSPTRGSESVFRLDTGEQVAATGVPPLATSFADTGGANNKTVAAPAEAISSRRRVVRWGDDMGGVSCVVVAAQIAAWTESWTARAGDHWTLVVG